MPMPSQMRLPKPISDDEFEEICVDVLSQKYSAVFQRFGRKGQCQNGIDLYSNGFCVVAQCKNHQNYSHIVEEIKSDYNKATKQFKPQKFIVATSLDRDTNTQIRISNIAQNIELLFWEDIEQIICNDIMLLRKHYQNLLSCSQFIPMEVLNGILRALDILKSRAKKIITDYFNYKPCYTPSTDIDLYNTCVDMFNASRELYNQLYNFKIQFEHKRIAEKIQCIIDSLPEFHDATNDIVGTELAVTICNFLKYFCNDENTTNYINLCQEVTDIIMADN